MRYKTKAFNERISSFVCRTYRICTILIPQRENSQESVRVWVTEVEIHKFFAKFDDDDIVPMGIISPLDVR